MIDQDQDGFIDADDLKEIFTSLGADPDDDFVNEMIAEAPGNSKQIGPLPHKSEIEF